MINRKETIEILAKVYVTFLNSIEWDNEYFISGINEGKNKFLSNAYIYITGSRKYEIANYFSKAAFESLNNQTKFSNQLVFEHMVPKSKYIQKPCEEWARNNEITEKKVFDLLDKYWHIATITKEEEKNLGSTKRMPENWDGNSHLTRYDLGKIELIPNPIWH